ncbi:MAG: cysteine synthase CysM [Flavobacteriaceae bacterium]
MNQLIDLIGNTPLVSVKSPNPKVEIYCKLEGQNPGGSVKDRAAYSMIKGALDRGEIKTGDHLVEATSGNTGIALAMIAAALGLNMHLIMPDTATEERVGAMRAYGAEVILTPGVKTIEYSRTLADELHHSKGYYLLNQFANDDNWLAHYRSTGPEIWRDTKGKISHFVSSMGTTGTIMGVSKYLKEQNRAIQIVGAQPTEGSKIPGIRRWSPEFLPKIFDASRVDQVRDVSRNEAENQMKLMAKEDAIFGGISSGGALFLAKKLAMELEGGLIVCITCDRGDRYLSTGIFS